MTVREYTTARVRRFVGAAGAALPTPTPELLGAEGFIEGVGWHICDGAAWRLLTGAQTGAPFYTARQRIINPLRYTVSGALELVSPVAQVTFTWFRVLLRPTANANAQWVRLVAGAASRIDAETELFNDENVAVSTARVKLVPVVPGQVTVGEFEVDPANPAQSLYLDTDVTTAVGTLAVIAEWG